MSREKGLEDFIFKCVGGLSVMICISSMIPQLYKMYKTKRTDDLSMKSYYINLCGITLIEIYTFYFNLWELFIPNILSFILILLQILMKKCYDNNNYGILDKQFLDNNDIKEEHIEVNISPLSNKSSSSNMNLDVFPPDPNSIPRL